MPKRYHGRSGAHVLPLLRARGLSITEAARQAGISRQMIYLVASGGAGVTAYFMDKMTALFPDLTADDVFPLVDDPAGVAS